MPVTYTNSHMTTRMVEGKVDGAGHSTYRCPVCYCRRRGKRGSRLVCNGRNQWPVSASEVKA